MLAQRCEPNATIVALEIDKAAAEQAKENVAQSPWKEQIEVMQCDFKQYHTSQKFDVIVSNPPYFIESLGCPDPQRNTARHNDSLSYGKLLEKIPELLTENGVFSLVIPTDMTETAKSVAFAHRLYPIRQTNVFTKPGKPARRTLLAFASASVPYTTEEMFIESGTGGYSDEYIALTKEYYLKFPTK
jgi:tRNA1Val (adenine37-N6)-methyltransferase